MELVDILHNRFGGRIKQPRIFEQPAQIFQCCSIVKSVTDPFVHDDGVFYNRFSLHAPFRRQFVFVFFGAKREKNRNVSEIIQMVENGRNAKRPHGGNKQRAVERREVDQLFRDFSEIIQKSQKTNGKTQK